MAGIQQHFGTDVSAHKTLFSPSFRYENMAKRCPIFKVKIWLSFMFGVL